MRHGIGQSAHMGHRELPRTLLDSRAGSRGGSGVLELFHRSGYWCWLAYSTYLGNLPRITYYVLEWFHRHVSGLQVHVQRHLQQGQGRTRMQLSRCAVPTLDSSSHFVILILPTFCFTGPGCGGLCFSSTLSGSCLRWTPTSTNPSTGLVLHLVLRSGLVP